MVWAYGRHPIKKYKLRPLRKLLKQPKKTKKQPPVALRRMHVWVQSGALRLLMQHCFVAMWLVVGRRRHSLWSSGLNWYINIDKSHLCSVGVV